MSYNSTILKQFLPETWNTNTIYMYIMVCPERVKSKFIPKPHTTEPELLDPTFQEEKEREAKVKPTGQVLPA